MGKHIDYIMDMVINASSGGGGGYPEPTGDITITQNGTHNVKSKARAIVAVPNPSTGELNITQNGTYDVTEKASAIVAVPNPSAGELNITENGTYDVTEKASAVVNVPNPSTGDINITQNGTYDVTEKASAVVAVPNPSTGELNITQNGTYDVTEKASAVVNVPSGGVDRAKAMIEKSLTGEFKLDDTLSKIGKYAFSGQAALTGVDIKVATPVAVETGAFYECSSLTRLKVNGGKAQFATIPANCFYGCAAIEDLDEFGLDTDAVTTIQNLFVFSNCSALKKISLPNASSMNNATWPLGVPSLKVLDVPLINYSSFSKDQLKDNQVLEKIRLNSVATLAHGVFNGCTALKEVELKSISVVTNDSRTDDGAFQDCSALERAIVNFSTTCQRLMFSDCSSLQHLEINGGTLGLNYGVFANCSSLTELLLRNLATAFTAPYSDPFAGTPIASGTGYIYVPARVLDACKSATNLSQYAAQFRALEDYTVDGTTTGDLDPEKI